MTDVFDTLVARAPSAAQGEKRRTLRLLIDGVTQTTSLPADGRYVLGRGADVHVHVSHPTVSRRHAEIVIEEGSMRIVDLGSANGTRLGLRELSPHASTTLELGELFSMGNVVGIVVEAAPGARPARSLGRGEIAAAIVRAAAFHREEGPFTVCTLRFGDAARHLDAVVALLPTGGRESHVAALSDGVLVALVAPIAAARARAGVETLAADFVRAGFVVTSGSRSCPEDGVTLAALLPGGDAPASDESPHATGAGGRDAASVDAGGEPVVGSAMRKVHDLVERVAATPTTVLILGETGVGKEVLARTVHERSDRASAAFVALNCAALHETLLESELFGYEKGAFTGATTAKTGLIEAAHGGTLFLDELGEMPLSTQAKLLRVLEERTVLPVGGVKPRPVDVRLTAATNRDLLAEIEAKRFRADLYYRLNGIVLRLPPLRERKEEIAPLARLFAEKAARALRRPMPRLPSDVLRALEAFGWPGNVRELRNAVERLVLLARGDVVALEHLPDELRARVGAASAAAVPVAGASSPRETLVAEDERSSSDWDTINSAHDALFDAQKLTAPPAPSGGGSSLEDEVAQLERQKISDALEKCAGNQTRAAEMLGITRRVLIGKMEKYRLPRPRR
jgi:DNA-binding NtrC family response regulator